MAFAVHIRSAVFKKMNLESCLQKVLASVADAVFGRNAADIYICGVQQFENLTQSLSCFIGSVKS